MAGISKKRIKTKKGEKIKYTISFYDVFGKQHTKGIFDTIKEAKKELWRYDEVEQTEKITYGCIFNTFLEKSKKRNALSTYENYEVYYDLYLKKFDSIEYEKINSLVWQDIFDDFAKKSILNAKNILKFAKASVNHLIKHEVLEKNVFNKIELPQAPKPKIHHLTKEQIMKVLEECKRSYPQYYVLLYMFIGTGAREGEILALTKEDYNIERHSIIINKQFSRNRLLNHPKTATSNREIYIFDELAGVLEEYFKTLKPDNPLLFPNKAGNYLNATNLRERFWKPLLKLCGINEKVRLHDLRGSYIDMILSSGLSVKFAQNQAGHAKAETTTNIYAKNNSDMIRAATSQLNSYFRKCEQNMSKEKNKQNNKVIQFPINRSMRGI